MTTPAVPYPLRVVETRQLREGRVVAAGALVSAHDLVPLASELPAAATTPSSTWACGASTGSCPMSPSPTPAPAPPPDTTSQGRDDLAARRAALLALPAAELIELLARLERLDPHG